MQRYILIGDSGHSKVIADCIASIGGQIVAKLDDKYTERFEEEAIVKGPLSLLPDILDVGVKVIIGIGSNVIRESISERLSLSKEQYATVVHKTAIISESAELGYGTVIMPGAIINADTKIGNHCIVNTASIIEHDNRLADYVHISPNTTLTGGVKVDEGTQVGAASVVLPGITVGTWSIVGAGSIVTKDLPNNITAVGSPAKIIKKEGLLK